MNLRLPFRRDAGLAEFLRASVWISSARMTRLLFGFVTTIIVARWYGTEATGFVALLNSVGVVFSVLAAFGLGDLLMRDFSATDTNLELLRKRHLYRSALVLVLLLFAFLAGPTLVGLYYRLPPFASASPSFAIIVAAATLLGWTLVTFNVSIVRALASAPSYSLFLLLPALINFAIVVALGPVSAPTPLLPSVALAAGAFITGLSALLLILIKLRRPRHTVGASPAATTVPHGNVCEPGSLLRSGFVFAVSAVSSMLVTEGSIIVAGIFLTPDQVGIYSVAQRLSLLAAFGLNSFEMVAAPRFSRLSSSGNLAQLKIYGRQVSAIIFWASLPIILPLAAFPSSIVAATVGPSFLPAAPAVTILMIGQAVNAYTGVTNTYLNMTGGQKVLARIITAAAVLNVALSTILIPLFGISGAAIAMTASLMFWNLAALTFIHRRDGFWLCWTPHRRSRGQAETGTAP